MTLPPGFCGLTQRHLDVPRHNEWLTERERAVLTDLNVLKRRSDWRLGRWTAKRLLLEDFRQHLHVRLFDDVEILAAADGAPTGWVCGQPADVTISISHSNGVGFCVASAYQDRLGCDVEWIEPRSEAFVSDYFTPKEIELVADASDEMKPLAATLIWSAKESVLKAVREGLRRDTRSVLIGLDLMEHGAHDWRHFIGRCTVGNEFFTGWWRVEDGYVYTAAHPVRRRAASAIH